MAWTEQPSVSGSVSAERWEQACVSAGIGSQPHYSGCRDLALGWVSADPIQLRQGEDGGAAVSEVQRSSLCSSGVRLGPALSHCSLSGWQSAHTAVIGIDSQQFGPKQRCKTISTMHWLGKNSLHQFNKRMQLLCEDKSIYKALGCPLRATAFQQKSFYSWVWFLTLTEIHGAIISPIP